ncbi:MAG: type IV pilin protein [Fibrobacterota bacterium]
MKNNRGFTLTELMVVIAVAGILASLAIPIYSNVTSKARSREFLGVLSQIETTQHQYYRENREYAQCDDEDDIRQKLGVNADMTFFDYTVEVEAGGDRFTATATLTRDLGRAQKDNTATVNQNGEREITGGLGNYVEDSEW